MDRILRVASFNAENFYLILDRLYGRDELDALGQGAYLAMNSSIYNPNKAREKIAAIASTIIDRDYDLVGLVEVGGMETLRNFNRIYLGDRYDCFLHEENSRRGIFAGALVKRGAFSRVEARAMPGAFSRNLLRLTLDLGGPGIFGPDGNFSPEELEVFVVHLKSQHGEDRGIAQRMSEIGMLASMVPGERCLVMGDFNGIAIRGEAQFEFEPFLALPLDDVLERVGVPVDRRWTHYHFGPRPNFAQLDYIFCTRDLEVLEARVVEDQPPLTRAARDRLPSDHAFLEALVRPKAGPPRKISQL